MLPDQIEPASADEFVPYRDAGGLRYAKQRGVSPFAAASRETRENSHDRHETGD
jgi:hypothetical protein